MADDGPTTLAVPQGHIADVITHLEMFERPQIEVPSSVLCVERWEEANPDEYRKLFRLVGEPWLWLSRLLLDDDELQEILNDPKNELYRVVEGGSPVGIIELDFTQAGECEIGFFGLVPDYNGQGHGKWLMAETLERAWRDDIKRVWLHTCTLDSPFALSFYQKAGFKAFKREVSMNRDPRLDGLLPDTAGPHIPIIS